ncbi:MAG: hypothetical protein HDS21_00225 [Bacteroides sp.]|nr:hypothetical protein [Bacteroides sp.]
MKLETYKLLRRNLSGIYIFDTLPQDNGRKQPTCIEDCTEPKRIQWLFSLEKSALTRTAQHLTETFDNIWKYLFPQEKEQLKRIFGKGPLLKNRRCKIVTEKADQVEIINRYCKIIKHIANIYHIAAKDSEAALAERELDHDQSINK